MENIQYYTISLIIIAGILFIVLLIAVGYNVMMLAPDTEPLAYHRSAGEKQAFKDFPDNRTVEQQIQGVPRQDIDTVMR